MVFLLLMTGVIMIWGMFNRPAKVRIAMEKSF